MLTSHRVQGEHPMSTIFTFVTVPEKEWPKRRRRPPNEIERIYECNWKGCKKAYGTLNHLNEHVTKQSHGKKRTPEGKFCIDACGGRWSPDRPTRTTPHQLRC